MSKLAHSNDKTMEQIERNAENIPDPDPEAQRPASRSERGNQAVDAIEYAIGILRDLKRRVPEVLTVVDVDALILNELNPGLVAARAFVSERGWMSCSERLPVTPDGPSTAARVLVWLEKDGVGWIAIRFYRRPEWNKTHPEWWSGGDAVEGENITHWQPLPERPADRKDS